MKRLILTALLSLVAAAALAAAPTVPPGQAVAIFAGGCFWCMEPPFDKLPGVTATISGYTGGRKVNPTYEEVSSGTTGHAEVVQVIYDPKKVSYEKLLEVYWVNVDPTVKDRQFCDGGTQYRTAIFYHDEAQRKAAEASKAALEKSKPFKEPIVTPIEMAGAFYPAEDYHQDYYKKNPVALQALPHRLRARRAPEAAVGRQGASALMRQIHRSDAMNAADFPAVGLRRGASTASARCPRFLERRDRRCRAPRRASRQPADRASSRWSSTPATCATSSARATSCACAACSPRRRPRSTASTAPRSPRARDYPCAGCVRTPRAISPPRAASSSR